MSDTMKGETTGDEAFTAPGSERWPSTPGRFRRWEGRATLGAGDDVWLAARDAVLRWGVKTRSGFRVADPRPVRSGERTVVTVRALGRLVREPVEVVAVVDEPGRAGFAYRALPGHPIRGEEAFVVERDGDEIRIVIRSLTRAADSGCWRVLFPVLLVAQRLVRRRYLRALRPAVRP